MMLRRFALISLFCLTPLASTAEAQRQLIFDPNASDHLAGWESKSFAGETRYQLATVEGRQLLQAQSDNSASGLFLERRVDLQRTPWLNWRWRVEDVVEAGDETQKTGDDYPARIYVVIDGGLLFWRTRALNYVWANGQPQGASWANAFAGEAAMMLAVRSGAAETGRLLTEKRNVRADFKQLLDMDVGYIDAVAIMTDTDNSGGQARAYYGEIWFSAD